MRSLFMSVLHAVDYSLRKARQKRITELSTCVRRVEFASLGTRSGWITDQGLDRLLAKMSESLSYNDKT